jgi:hypothetical protein
MQIRTETWKFLRGVLTALLLSSSSLWAAESFSVVTRSGRALFELETPVAVGENFLTITYPSGTGGEGESGRLSDFFKGLGSTAESTKYSFLGIDGDRTLIVKYEGPSGSENFHFRFRSEGRSVITLPTHLKEFPHLKLEVIENADSTMALKPLNRPQKKR